MAKKSGKMPPAPMPTRGMSERMDKGMDKKAGIKETSARDKRLDKPAGKKTLYCGGKGPCCHVGYNHRHCEHCDVVIDTRQAWPYQPYYEPSFPYYRTGDFWPDYTPAVEYFGTGDHWISGSDNTDVSVPFANTGGNYAYGLTGTVAAPGEASDPSGHRCA